MLAAMPVTIAELEAVAAQGWRAPEEAPLGQWLLRAAEGFSGRANSALAVGDPGMALAEAIGHVCDWYAARGLPPMIAVPHPLDRPGDARVDRFLGQRGWGIRPGALVVMTAATAEVARSGAAVEAELRPEPDPDWLDLYHGYREAAQCAGLRAGGEAPWPVCHADSASSIYQGDHVRYCRAGGSVPTRGKSLWSGRKSFVSWRSAWKQEAAGVPLARPGPNPQPSSREARQLGQELPQIARRLLLSAPFQAFACIRRDGGTVAIGRAAVAAGWGGLSAVAVHPRYRRAGLATAITAALAGAAAGQGAARLYLQVEEGNEAARALYARRGFTCHHRYHYRIAPAAG
jgi:GNAT superfamily N-acetyltransferase